MIKSSPPLCCKCEDFEIFVTLGNPNFMYKFDHLYVLSYRNLNLEGAFSLKPKILAKMSATMANLETQQNNHTK